MFFYFGRKARLASTYPAPEYPLVIEPFAGSMAYTLHYRPKYAIGIDAEPRVVDLWHRLTSMTEDEIKDAAPPVLGERTDDLWHLLSCGGLAIGDTNYRIANPFMIEHFERQRKLALRHLHYARTNIIYRLGDYTEAPDVEATWFIDPPYRGQHRYRYRPNDYRRLAAWIRSRRGQVIVCEGAGAKWLPFQQHADQPTSLRLTAGMAERSTEVVWTARTSRPCDHCGHPFDARADARFCSTRCRVAAHRAGA